MVVDLENAERIFEIKDLNENRVRALRKKLIDCGNVFDKEIQAEINLYLSFIDGTASRIDRIYRALQVVEWKAELQKYDLVKNQQNVLIHYKKVETPGKW